MRILNVAHTAGGGRGTVGQNHRWAGATLAGDSGPYNEVGKMGIQPRSSASTAVGDGERELDGSRRSGKVKKSGSMISETDHGRDDVDEGKHFLVRLVFDLDVLEGHLRDLRSVHCEKVHEDGICEELERFAVY